MEKTNDFYVVIFVYDTVQYQIIVHDQLPHIWGYVFSGYT